MVGTITSGRPGGNPNIAKTSKPGPVTVEGKLRSMLSSSAMKRNLRASKGSKILRKVRQCDFCPMRTKTIKKTINGKDTEITHYSTCPGYKPGNKKCIMPIADYVDKVDNFINVIEEQNMMELQKALIAQSLMDAQANREYETMEKGRPGFYTNTFNEQAMKYTNEMNKIVVGERVRHEIEGEVEVKEVVEHEFSEEQLRRIADIMLEDKAKNVEVEGKVVADVEEKEE